MTLLRAIRSRRRRALPFGLLIAVAACATFYLTFFPSVLPAYASYYLSSSPPLDSAIAHIQRRAFATGALRPVCPAYAWQEARYAGLRNTTNVFLAVNFFNNEAVLPTFFQELPVLLRYLDPARVFVSIYENGSTDRTTEMLAMLEDMLTVMGVPHRVVYSAPGDISRTDHQHRIAVLAAVRNRALEPLYMGEAAHLMPGGRFDTLLFVNDVVFCAADMLELLHEKALRCAHAVCALDWDGAWIYDTWVLRDMRGEMVYKNKRQDISLLYTLLQFPLRSGLAYALPDAPTEHARLASHLPIQVFSCWNGAAAFDADAFAGPNGIRFRMARADLDDHGIPRKPSELLSEAYLSSVDMWKRNKGKILLVPKASLAYDVANYRLYRKDHIEPPAHESSEAFEWALEPPAEVAILKGWQNPLVYMAWDAQ